MSTLWFDGLLTQVNDAGVYFLPEDDIDELLEAAAVNRFPCLRVNLRDCCDKHDLLLRLSGVLGFSPHVASDFAALSVALAGLRMPGTPGLVLLLEDSQVLRVEAREQFKGAMEALQAVSADWARQSTPLWSFITLDENAFAALD